MILIRYLQHQDVTVARENVRREKIMVSIDVELKAALFDQIIEGYFAEEIDDRWSSWEQGSWYDNIVTSYLGIPTVFNGLMDEWDW